MLTRLEKIMPQHARICMYNIAQSEGHLLTGSGEFDLHAFKPVSANIYIYELKVKVMCFSSISDFGCLKESVAHETLQSKPQTYTGGHSCGSYYPGFDV